MNYLRIIIVFGFGFNRGFCQDSFAYECDIYERLEHLEENVKTWKDMKNDVDYLKSVVENMETWKDVKDEVDYLKSVVGQFQAGSYSGSTYVRWGRTTCPGNGSDLVYQGVAGGSGYNHSGAAVNYLCLPLDPDYDVNSDTTVHGWGMVIGAEYEIPDSFMNLFDIGDKTLLNHDVPCSVCHVRRDAMIMLPAKNKCMDGWTLEYKGLLVAGNLRHASASEYVCLDHQAEVATGGEADKDGKLMFPVGGTCTNLPCPPYENGKAISCAVCTK